MRTSRSVVVGLGGLAALWAVGWSLRVYGSEALAAVGAQPSDRPPITDVLLTPAASLPLTVAAWLLALAGLAALVLAAFALAGPVARRYGRTRGPVALAAAALALVAEPVRATLGAGHLDVLLFGLIVADVVALRRAAWARRRAAWWPDPAAARPQGLRRAWSTGAWGGAGIGVATALAVGPALFILYLLVTRQWRPAMIALGTATTLTLGGLLVEPRGFALSIDHAGSIGDPANQSLAGLLARLYDSSSTPVLVWLSFAALLLAVGLIRARGAHADGDEITAFTLVGLTGAAIAPVTTGHGLVWVLPAVLILADAAARSRIGRRPRPRRFTGAGYAAAALGTYLIFVSPLQWTVGWNAYGLAVIVLMNALPWRPAVAPARTPVRRPAVPARVPAIPGPRGS
ncbi:glycosyltransferase family 87 protein [Actinoplanes sp. Pm04-4]|uniref:Glycosyltransferase family 87 protein n=1 Tax=Paractinoplanes pyxinae TaxID=2997416 RepID=A0ABT4B452_9ACTN|nr:glycosyltransferase family 87 protein [Actinoplanes pyxinae]MCY1141261.1 glycosyltransferase family 87 protein [Actinoplanes pyxinae]